MEAEWAQSAQVLLGAWDQERDDEFVGLQYLSGGPRLFFGVRSAKLSITHIFCQAESEMNVSQPGHAAPQYGVTGWCVSSSTEVATQLREADQCQKSRQTDPLAIVSN